MLIDDIFFEKIIFYKIVTDEIYLASIIDNLKKEYFKNSDIQSLIEIITDFYKKRNKSPSLTEIKTYLTTDALKKSFKTVVNSFSEIDKNLDKDELYHNTETFLKERAVLCTLMEAIKDFESNSIDSSKMLQQFEKACCINLHNETGLDLFNNVDLVIKHLKESTDYLKTQWKWLDEKLGGGLLKNGRALYIFAGETNIGKSIFLGNLADNIASQGKTVLLITLEMPEILYAQRIYTKTTKIPISELPSELECLRSSIEEYKLQTPGARILVKEFPPSTVTVNHLKAYIKKVISTGIKLDAIVIDYINLIASSIGSNSYERIKYVTEQVRALSYIFNVPILSATQLGRCVALNTEIIRENNIVDLIKNLKIGDKIKGSNGFVEVRHVYPIERKNVYKIKTKSGKEIICSKEHIFPTKNGIKSINSGLCLGDKLFTATQVSNYIEDEIVSIELLPDLVDTIDICVSGDNLFCANNILTHNSAFGQSDPGLETVSESIGLAATADVICGISQDEADKEMNIISLSMMKNRFGRRDCIQKMKIDYSTLTISEDKHYNDTEMGTSTEKVLRILSN